MDSTKFDRAFFKDRSDAPKQKASLGEFGRASGECNEIGHIQNWVVGYERVTAFEFTFNDFWDKRTIGRILKASFVDYKRLKRCDLDSKPDLDIQPIVV